MLTNRNYLNSDPATLSQAAYGMTYFHWSSCTSTVPVRGNFNDVIPAVDEGGDHHEEYQPGVRVHNVQVPQLLTAMRSSGIQCNESPIPGSNLGPWPPHMQGSLRGARSHCEYCINNTNTSPPPPVGCE